MVGTIAAIGRTVGMDDPAVGDGIGRFEKTRQERRERRRVWESKRSVTVGWNRLAGLAPLATRRRDRERRISAGISTETRQTGDQRSPSYRTHRADRTVGSARRIVVFVILIAVWMEDNGNVREHGGGRKGEMVEGENTLSFNWILAVSIAIALRPITHPVPRS